MATGGRAGSRGGVRLPQRVRRGAEYALTRLFDVGSRTFGLRGEDVLYVLAGTGRHSFDGQTVELRPGCTIRVPAGVKHNFVNTGTETITCLISFSAGVRETVFLE